MPKRPKSSQIVRLAASALAAVGLLGHGLAMLLVAVLAQPPSAAAQSGFPGLAEICRADGAIPTAGREAPSPITRATTTADISRAARSARLSHRAVRPICPMP
jgi:hypothetical protein